MAQNKDPFRIEDLRNEYALKKQNRKLQKTYASKFPEIRNINTPGYWNKKFLEERESYKKNIIYKDKINIVAKFLSGKKGKFLDIGIGFGYLEGRINKTRELHLSGIDISGEVINYAKKNFNGEFKKGSILKIPFKNHKFDVVSALDVLEHISPRNIFKAYKEVSRVLKSKGFFIVSAPINEGLEILYKEGRQTGGHVRVYTTQLITRELEIAGFKIRKTITKSAYRKYYVIKNLITGILPLRKPNMVIILAQKI